MKRSLLCAAACLAAAVLLTGCQGAASSSASASSEAEINQETPDYSLGLTDEGLFDGVDVTACVTLPDYRQVPSGEAFTTVSEEDLQAAIDQFMSSYATDTQITDRAVEDGDTVNLTYTGSIDGQVFEGGSAENQDYTAGSDELIDDFLTQIIGAMPGGTHLIEILNILENFDMASMEVNSAEYVHLFAETFKLAFADRAKYMADTNFVTVPLGGLTSQAYADKRAQDIDLNAAMEQAAPDDPSPYEHTDTTHFSVADVNGNCVAITKTINYYFGSGVMVDGYGFMMNNQMDDFSTDSESVNKIEPGKKPLSSMSPTVVLKPDGSPFLVLGTPGGSRIFSGVAEVISRVIDHKMSLHDAICVPKIWNNGGANNLQYENPLKGYEQYAVTQETLDKLVEMDHGEIKTAASGAVQAIEFLQDGTLYGTADPRQDGKAVGVN